MIVAMSPTTLRAMFVTSTVGFCERVSVLGLLAGLTRPQHPGAATNRTCGWGRSWWDCCGGGCCHRSPVVLRLKPLEDDSLSPDGE
jgi:hypothetical protein